MENTGKIIRVMGPVVDVRFDSGKLKITASVIIFIFLIPYTASLYNGLSRLFAMAFDIDYAVCVVVMAVLTGVYVIAGGYMATAINDFIQGIIMIFGIIAVIVAVLNTQGGLTGALDSLGGTRQQYILAYAGIMDSVAQSQKTMMTGQMSLFDLVDEDQKASFQAKLPDVGEYPKELLLSFEKEVLGIYVSGHPLEEYEGRWRKNITAVTTDFQLDEETNRTKVRDGQQVVVGGMITGKTVKYTKNNRVMAFLQPFVTEESKFCRS